MSKILKSRTDTDANVIQTVNGESFKLDNVSGYSLQVVATVAVPSPVTFVDADVDLTYDEVDITAHGFSIGVKVQLTTSGTLPAGLALATDYFISVTDVDTLAFADSIAEAESQTLVDITAAAGGGTHTVTAVALAGATITHQLSNDNTNWTDVAAATSITVTDSFNFTATDPAYKFTRLVYTLTAGLINFTNVAILRRNR